MPTLTLTLTLASTPNPNQGSPAFAPLHAAVHGRAPAAARPAFDVWSGGALASAEGLVLQLMERAPPAAEQPLDVGGGGVGGGGGGGGGGGAARPEAWRLRCGGALPSKQLLAAPSDEELELPLLDAAGAEVAALRLVLPLTPTLSPTPTLTLTLTLTLARASQAPPPRAAVRPVGAACRAVAWPAASKDAAPGVLHVNNKRFAGPQELSDHLSR